ncbi:MAG TPA: methionyl-tRNA formyltransferase [Candidatus Limnocylindrales bacterium]|nr:methionyl-tRNA formyltransferase [Candidatus Limnocylindrales bacterium]
MGGIGRIAFLGTGAFGVPLLARVVGMADDLVVVSQPDRPAGRRLQMRATPVTAFAREHGIPVLTPQRLRSEEAGEAVRAYAPDGLVLVAYGQLVPQELLDIAARPPLNVHPSLLPRHRGAAPVAGTILAGDREGGVTLMVMTAELDAGPIVRRWPVPLTGRETTPELEAALADLAAEVVPPELERWASGPIEPEPQDGTAATYVHPFARADGWIDWQRPATEIDRQVRALQPWPGAWTTVDGRRIHIRRARAVTGVDGVPIGAMFAGETPIVACGVGALMLEIVQPEGRATMPADAWRRGLGREHVMLGAARPAEVVR